MRLLSLIKGAGRSTWKLSANGYLPSMWCQEEAEVLEEVTEVDAKSVTTNTPLTAAHLPDWLTQERLERGAAQLG